MVKIGSRILLVVAVLLSSIGGAWDSEDAVVLNVPLVAQETDNWCWAASAQMVKNYLLPATAPKLQQCDEAGATTGVSNCCATREACDKRRWPSFTTSSFRSKDSWPTPPPVPAPPPPPVKPLTWETIKAEIDANRPFVFAWKSAGGGGHMVVVTGYGTSDGVRYLFVNDPSPVNEGTFTYYTYDWYAAEAEDAPAHWRDYYEIEYTGTEK